MVALDTNILLLNAENLFSFGSEILLTETVLEEIDNKKSVLGDIGYQARQFARIFGDSEIVSMVQKKSYYETVLLCKNIHVTVVSNVKYDTTGSKSDNDQKIISAILTRNKENQDDLSSFVSNDMMCRLQARIAGLDSTDFKIVEDTGYNFVKNMIIKSPDMFKNLHYMDIYEVDTEYVPENYSYVFECNHTGQKKIARIVNGIVSVLGKDTEKELRRQNVNPCNTEQLLMSRAIQDSSVDIITVEAQAGSGKTLVAVSNAMRLLDTNKDKYDSIVYMRNTVDDVGMVDEEVGFLSGNAEKFAVYLGPMEDTLDFMVRSKLKAKKINGQELEDAVSTGIEDIRTRYNIQSMVSLGLRGRTLTNCVVIIDEAQNIGANTMQKIISRIGKNCKVIVIGSNRQIDSVYLTKWNNGLSMILDYCKNPTFQTDIGLFAINLEKTVRSDIARFAEQLFSKS